MTVALSARGLGEPTDKACSENHNADRSDQKAGSRTKNNSDCKDRETECKNEGPVAGIRQMNWIFATTRQVNFLGIVGKFTVLAVLGIPIRARAGDWNHRRKVIDGRR